MSKLLLAFLTVGVMAQPTSRSQIYSALMTAHVLNPERELVHLSITCMLHIEQEGFAVVDVQEMVKSSTTPRGVNRIVVLNPKLTPVKLIEYTTQRPLFCVDNRLYVFGDLDIDNALPEGNVLNFSDHGKTLTLHHVEASEYPIPATKDRKTSPQ